MIKQMAWNTFKNTGNINTFMELMEVENLEKNIEDKQYGIAKNEGNNNLKWLILIKWLQFLHQMEKSGVLQKVLEDLKVY